MYIIVILALFVRMYVRLARRHSKSVILWGIVPILIHFALRVITVVLMGYAIDIGTVSGDRMDVMLWFIDGTLINVICFLILYYSLKKIWSRQKSDESEYVLDQ